MPRSTLTSKGQITVPKAVREALHLESGDRIAFEVRPDGVVEMRPEAGELMGLYGALKTQRSKPVSVRAMQQAIRRGGTRT